MEIRSIVEALDVNHRIQSERFTVWVLGFRQCSFRLAIRVSTGMSIDGFSISRLSKHANFPFDFRRQVDPVTHGYHAQPIPCCMGIIQAAMRRTHFPL
jgi:hypothetical protein